MKNIRSRLAAVSAALLGFITPLVASAQGALPTMEDPSRGTGTGFIATLQNYLFDILTLAGLVISAVALYMVGGAAIGKYKEVQAGKATWGDFGTTGGAGALLIVVVIFLLTKAATIL